MVQGIAIYGLNGGGKSTLTHALAKTMGYYEMDVEDYYFPEQRESRQWALENSDVINTDHLGKLPFSNPRSKSEVENAILDDIEAHPNFILSGVTMNWSDEILSHINIAFWIQAPLEERLKRINRREEKRFGPRVLLGGDMYKQQIEFQNVVANRDLKSVEESTTKLRCPIIIVDGLLPVTKNVQKIMDYLNIISSGESL